jgi:NAD(P)-dependent dehydrogenase (short-subunit alcohol dehydrogenase family)
MRTVVVTGSASGIGRATAELFRGRQERVIGVDRHDADVEVDLATAEGRAAMVDQVARLSGGTIDGLVAGAGVSGPPGDVVVAVNYFGAVATLDGLRPLLARGHEPAAVAIASNSASTQEGCPADLVEACLAGDEATARDLAAPDRHGVSSYPASKLALARWVRRRAPTPDWIGAGIRLNAVAPGYIATPMTAGAEGFMFDLGDAFPIPIGRAGTASEVASLLAYLLGPEAGFFCGSVVYMDGGTDAAVRADDWPDRR